MSLGDLLDATAAVATTFFQLNDDGTIPNIAQNVEYMASEATPDGVLVTIKLGSVEVARIMAYASEGGEFAIEGWELRSITGNQSSIYIQLETESS